MSNFDFVVFLYQYMYVGRCCLSQLYIKKTDPNLAHPLFTTLYVNLKCSYKIEHRTLVKSGPSHKKFSFLNALIILYNKSVKG